MPRKKTLKLSAINVKTMPHSTDMYIWLFTTIFTHKLKGNIRGSDFLMIGSLNLINQNDSTRGLYGTFYKFTSIDPNSPWLNTDTLEPVEGDALDNAVYIPKALKPNMKEIAFVFYPTSHKLIFEYSSVSPQSIKKAFIDMCSSEEIQFVFESITAIVEASHSGIEQLLKTPCKQRIEIKLSKPNPLQERSWMTYSERLDNMNADTIGTVLTTKSKSGIDPDEEIMEMARDTSLDGEMNITAIKDGKTTKLSTNDIPRIEYIKYDASTQTLLDAVINGANIFLE